MHPSGALRERDPDWAWEIVDALYFSVMRRTDQIAAREHDTEKIVASVLAKNEIDQRSVRQKARKVLGHVPERISREAVAGGGDKLMNRIILHAGMAAQKAAEDAIKEHEREDTRREVLIRVTRDSIEIESVYDRLTDHKPIFKE